MCRSVPQMDATLTLTRTSFGPNPGTLTSRISAPGAAFAFTTASIVSAMRPAFTDKFRCKTKTLDSSILVVRPAESESLGQVRTSAETGGRGGPVLLGGLFHLDCSHLLQRPFLSGADSVRNGAGETRPCECLPGEFSKDRWGC